MGESLTITLPVDGAEYVPHVLAEPKEVKVDQSDPTEPAPEVIPAPEKEKQPDLYEAFTSRFGPNWLEDATTRRVYVSLLLKTESVSDLRELCNYVTTLSDEDARGTLRQLQRAESDIVDETSA